MVDKYIFDLDNTLINTDLLNNKSYNYALAYFNLPTIISNVRITRDLVFSKLPRLSEKQRSDIVTQKQLYFLKHIHITIPNNELINLLKSKNKSDCVLWTSADDQRVKLLLSYYCITDCFYKIIYSKKTSVKEDVFSLCSIFNCSKKSLLFFEDDLYVIAELKELDCRIVK